MSDYSDALVTIDSKGMHLITHGLQAMMEGQMLVAESDCMTAQDIQLMTELARGAGYGVAETVHGAFTLEHWVNLVTGMPALIFHRIAVVCDMQVQSSVITQAFIESVVSGDKGLYEAESKKLEEQNHLRRQSIKQALIDITSLSAHDFAKSAAHFGTMLVLDSIGLHALNLAASVAGRSLVSKMATVLESPKASQTMAEVAGVGKVAFEEGTEVAGRAIEIIANNPELIQEFTNVATKSAWGPVNMPAHAIYKELATLAPEIMPKQNLKHYFLGEILIKKGVSRLQGFHHARSYPERIKEIIIPKDVHGCYYAKYVYKGLEKKSTFFPDHWDRITVLNKINEAYKNPIIFDAEAGFIGKTADGIHVRMWFIKDKNTQKIIINSAYPLMEGVK